MEIRKPNLSSAAVILKNRMASKGIKLTHAEALEHAAAMEGYQSFQAYQAHQKKIAEWEKPSLELESASESGRDYRFVGGKEGGVWIRMRNISIKLNPTDEGVVVDMHNSGAEDESEASTYYFYHEAAGAQLELAEELDDMKDHIKKLLANENVVIFSDPDAVGFWSWKVGKSVRGTQFTDKWSAYSAAFESTFS